MKYLRASDPELLSETYEIYAQKYLMTVPLPTVEAVRPVLEELAPRNPKAKDQDPRKFFEVQRFYSLAGGAAWNPGTEVFSEFLGGLLVVVEISDQG